MSGHPGAVRMQPVPALGESCSTAGWQPPPPPPPPSFQFGAGVPRSIDRRRELDTLAAELGRAGGGPVAVVRLPPSGWKGLLRNVPAEQRVEEAAAEDWAVCVCQEGNGEGGEDGRVLVLVRPSHWPIQSPSVHAAPLPQSWAPVEVTSMGQFKTCL